MIWWGGHTSSIQTIDGDEGLREPTMIDDPLFDHTEP